MTKPPVGPAADSVAEATASPVASRVGDPATEATADPVASTAADSAAGATASPVASRVADPAAGAAADPVASTAADPAPGATADPATEATASRVANTAADPATGATADPATGVSADAAIRTFQTACQTADVELLLTVLAADVVFRSPLTTRTVFTGHDQIADLMSAALATVRGIEYHTELGDERTRALVSTARVDGEEIEEVALLRLDDEARITEITLWVRPLPGATALMKGIGPRLLRRLGRDRMALVLPAMSRPLGFLVRFADRQAVGMLKRR